MFQGLGDIYCIGENAPGVFVEKAMTGGKILLLLILHTKIGWRILGCVRIPLCACLIIESRQRGLETALFTLNIALQSSLHRKCSKGFTHDVFVLSNAQLLHYRREIHNGMFLKFFFGFDGHQ